MGGIIYFKMLALGMHSWIWLQMQMFTCEDAYITMEVLYLLLAV